MFDSYGKSILGFEAHYWDPYQYMNFFAWDSNINQK